MVIFNLPREVRYKRENVILIGLIPGPKEPPLSINSYLTPLVSELLKLWNGVQMPVPVGHSEFVRCALIVFTSRAQSVWLSRLFGQSWMHTLLCKVFMGAKTTQDLTEANGD